MTSIPKISVIISTYNQEKFIGRCLRSLLDQSLERFNYEIVIIDDASIDKTLYALNLFKEDIKIISSNKIGSNHIMCILGGKDGSTFKAFAWNAINSPLEPFLNKTNKKRINVAGRLKLNEWKGKKNVEFAIEDIALN